MVEKLGVISVELVKVMSDLLSEYLILSQSVDERVFFSSHGIQFSTISYKIVFRFLY